MSIFEIIGFCLLLCGPIAYLIISVAVLHPLIDKDISNRYSITKSDEIKQNNGDNNVIKIHKYDKIRKIVCFSFLCSGLLLFIIHCVIAK